MDDFINQNQIVFKPDILIFIVSSKTKQRKIIICMNGFYVFILTLILKSFSKSFAFLHNQIMTFNKKFLFLDSVAKSVWIRILELYFYLYSTLSLFLSNFICILLLNFFGYTRIQLNTSQEYK